MTLTNTELEQIAETIAEMLFLKNHTTWPGSGNDRDERIQYHEQLVVDILDAIPEDL